MTGSFKELVIEIYGGNEKHLGWHTKEFRLLNECSDNLLKLFE